MMNVSVGRVDFDGFKELSFGAGKVLLITVLD
jgi:hypothetical protein